MENETMNPIRKLVHDLSVFNAEARNQIREVRPFYWIMILALVIIYVASIKSTPALLQPAKFILFTALMLLHGVLHWLSPALTVHRRWQHPYFFLQGLLALLITYLSNNQGITLGLFFALAGEAVGVMEDLRRSLIWVLIYLLLFGLNIALNWGSNALTFWLAVSIPLLVFVIVYVTMFTRQAQAREKAQKLLEELEIAHRQLAEYAAQVEDLTLAAERQRMARELHDTLAQGLAGLILQLEAADSHLSRQRPERAQAIIQQAMQRARTTLADARHAIDDLRQTSTVRVELPDALNAEIGRFTSVTGIPCHLEIGDIPALPEPLNENILRAVAEGLANIARHAQASQAWVRIACREELLTVDLQDDGKGFDPQDAVWQTGHYGLTGMRERARLLGGSLEIQTAPGQGTLLSLHLPLKEVGVSEGSGSE